MQMTCRQHSDDVQMTYGRHKSETSLEISAGGWHMSSGCHLHVVCMSSAGVYVIHMSSAGMCVIHTSSAALLMVTVDLNYLSTVTGTGY